LRELELARWQHDLWYRIIEAAKVVRQVRMTDGAEIRHPLAALHTYLQDIEAAGAPICARTGCKRPAVRGGAYCGNACRQAAYRERHSTGLQ
jgi:hypothetical protein